VSSAALERTRLADRREQFVVAAVAVLILAACLPLTRVFLGTRFLFPVAAAALLALGVDWGARRLGAGPGLTLAATVAGWLLYAGLLFARETLIVGLVPTPATLGALRDLWLEGLALVRVSPSPTYVEPPLLLLAVTGVWAVAHAADGLVVRLAAPISAIVLALVLWTVPLALAPAGGTAWMWAAPFLAAAAGVLLASAGADLGRFGRWVHPDDPGGLRSAGSPVTRGGLLLAGGAIAAGSVLAGSLPGFGAPPWYELRGSGGTTLTSNPIVGIHSRLVANDPSTLLRVTSPRPLYLKTASLDVYDPLREIWTTEGVAGSEVDGVVTVEAPLAQAAPAQVELEVVADLDGTLVPMPYQTIAVQDSTPGRLRYDSHLQTFFVDDEQPLRSGDRFSTIAAVPAPSAAQLDVASTAVDPALTALPDDIPPEVGQMARDIVARAGADSRLEQAVALQNELRSWTYSLDVVPSQRTAAILAFLQRREGYCEQFAGTMTIMLRELGIPARVAVGFTPGVPADPAAVGTGQPVTYTVSLANAHAWPEVYFPGYGWIAFEPTPRSDGNVIVPTAQNLAPSTTVTPPQQTTPDTIGPQPEDFLNDQQQAEDIGLPGVDRPRAASPTAGGAGRAGLPLLALLAIAAGGVGTAVVLRARRGAAPRPPLERVLRARDRVRRLGAGTGLPPRPTETETEYLERLLTRLAAARETGPSRAATLLRVRADQAQWARELPEGAAEDAESAAGQLEEAMLAGRPLPRRLVIRARAALAGLSGGVRRGLGRRRGAKERELVGAGRG
jgi:transglutaminase-like putative cysteine protease